MIRLVLWAADLASKFLDVALFLLPLPLVLLTMDARSYLALSRRCRADVYAKEVV